MILNQILTGGIIGTLVFIILLLLCKRSNTATGYRLLALLFLLLTFVFAEQPLDENRIYDRFPFLKVVFQPLLFAFPPLIYFSVVYLTVIEKRLSVSILFHLLPYLLVVSLYLYQYSQPAKAPGENAHRTTLSDFKPSASEHLARSTPVWPPVHPAVVQPPAREQADSADPAAGYNLLEEIIVGCFFIQIGSYLLLALGQLKAFRRKLPLFVSNLEDNDFHWLGQVIIGLGLIVLVSFAESMVQTELFYADMSYAYSLFYLIGFYYIGIQVYRQNEVFPFTEQQRMALSDLMDKSGMDKTSNEPGTEHTYPDKDQICGSSATWPGQIIEDEFVLLDKSGGNCKLEADSKLEADHPTRIKTNPQQDLQVISSHPHIRKKVIADPETREYKARLLELMQQTKPHLNAEISLPALSQLLDLTTYQTSYLINTCFHENFYHFINRHRVEACKKMLADPAYNHLSLLAIGYEAGFNSKTAFNTFFKKSTGLSPNKYKAKLQKEKRGDLTPEQS